MHHWQWLSPELISVTPLGSQFLSIYAVIFVGDWRLKWRWRPPHNNRQLSQRKCLFSYTLYCCPDKCTFRAELNINLVSQPAIPTDTQSSFLVGGFLFICRDRSFGLSLLPSTLNLCLSLRIIAYPVQQQQWESLSCTHLLLFRLLLLLQRPGKCAGWWFTENCRELECRRGLIHSNARIKWKKLHLAYNCDMYPGNIGW